jgi:trimeric autotransporter adhesin
MPLSSSRPRRRHPARSLSGSRPLWRAIRNSAIALTVTATVIIGSSMTGSAEVPSGWSEAARDGFSRTVSDGWGSADVGGAYKISGSANAVSASGSTGVVKLGAGHEFAASLPNVSIGDVDISDTATVTGATTYDLFHGWGVRRQDDGSSYNIRVRFSSSGKSTLGVSRRIGSTSTWLSGVSLPTALRAGQTFHGNVQVTGTSPVLIRARVWIDGSSKPDWQLRHSDSDSARITGKGAVALRDYAKTASSRSPETTSLPARAPSLSRRRRARRRLRPRLPSRPRPRRPRRLRPRLPRVPASRPNWAAVVRLRWDRPATASHRARSS